LVEEVVRVNSRQYSALGEVIDELTRKRNVRGPHAIANHMKSRLGEAPTGAAVSKWMYGDSRPTRENMQRFAGAFPRGPDGLPTDAEVEAILGGVAA
jgi:hypothetical protein